MSIQFGKILFKVFVELEKVRLRLAEPIFRFASSQSGIGSGINGEIVLHFIIPAKNLRFRKVDCQNLVVSDFGKSFHKDSFLELTYPSGLVWFLS